MSMDSDSDTGSDMSMDSDSLDRIISDKKVHHLKNCVGKLLKSKVDLYGEELKERVTDDIIQMETDHRIYFKSHYAIKNGNTKRICYPTDEQKKNYLLYLIFNEFGNNIYIYHFTKDIANTSTAIIPSTNN